jgi:hypothetical protein
MKKKIFILLLIIVGVTLCACATSKFNDIETPQTNPAPPQPILFNTLEDAIAFIHNPDLSNYNENFQNAYQNMITEFQDDGYINTVTHNVAMKYDNTVTLYPEATYEDVGIHYLFVFNKELYQVVIYTIKAGEEYVMDPQTETIVDYYSKRWGSDCAVSSAQPTNNALVPMVFFTETADGRICAQSLIDEGHYMVVRAKSDAVNISDLVAFIEGLKVERIALE